MPNALAQFLWRQYPSLRLAAPLFHNWPIYLRFDLQDDALATSDDAYFQEVVRRASLLFQAVFAPTDSVLVVYQYSRYKRHRLRNSNFLIQQLSVRKADVHFQRIVYPHFFAPHQWSRAHFVTSASQIPHAAILAAIANQDFCRTPALHGQVFFLNQRTGLAFHMYDDRGLDILGPDAESLLHLYEAYNELILDYDRTRITALFT
ncbi:hypothetical protein GCM10027346_11680 [Hymenobacter seoulensis]